MKVKESVIWKQYPLDFDFEGEYVIEISNLGEVKTYSVLHPEGKLLQCSRVQGYPILKKTFLKKRSEKDQQLLDDLQNEIQALNEKIKETSTLKLSTQEKKNVLSELRASRDRLIAKRKAKNAKINKKRSIYFSLLIHKAVAELFLEKPAKEGMMIIHKDFNKENNRASNLEWVEPEVVYSRFTQNPLLKLKKFEENLLGEKKVNVRATKLSENDVLYIKEKIQKGNVSLKKLANQFGVSEMQIRRIKSGENWSHVKTIKELLDNKK